MIPVSVSTCINGHPFESASVRNNYHRNDASTRIQTNAMVPDRISTVLGGILISQLLYLSTN